MEVLDIFVVEDLVVDTMPLVLPERLVVVEQEEDLMVVLAQRALLTLVLEVVVVAIRMVSVLLEQLVSALFVIQYKTPYKLSTDPLGDPWMVL